jgi:hypothetical protein
MTKTFNPRNILIASTIAAFGVLALAATSAEASVASNMQNCKASSKKIVIDCCEQHVRDLGHRPKWMVQSGLSCRTAAKCVSAGSSGPIAISYVADKPRIKKCYIPEFNNWKFEDGEKGNRSTKGDQPKRDPQRDPKTPGKD